MSLMGDIVNESVSVDFDFLFIDDVGLLQRMIETELPVAMLRMTSHFDRVSPSTLIWRIAGPVGSCKIDIFARSFVDFSGIGISFPAIAELRLRGTHRMDHVKVANLHPHELQWGTRGYNGSVSFRFRF